MRPFASSRSPTPAARSILVHRGLRALGVALLLPIASSPVTPARAYAQPVPSPADFHGYELGTRYTITEALYAYYQALAEASPRVDYHEYGRSIQGRALPQVIVSSEANLARLAEIRAATRRIGGAEGPVPDEELEELVASTPAVVWIFVVDTDEEAGVEVLQEVAHGLATREDDGTRGIRDDVVTILTPLTNPDSHARYVTWHKIYNVEGASTDPLAIENRAHWAMNTDGNAWGVDVNRDFGWFVTPEMQALARTVMAWRPQFFLDVHSGPNVIFFPPFPRPYHPLWPDEASKWWNALAGRADEHFGRRGWSFKSRVDYEGVAGIGFGLSWGMLGPAVSSFLYETFGGRPGKTLAFRRSDGTLATLRMAMDRHEVGIRALLELARDRREELLEDSHEKAVRAMDEARRRDVRAVAIPASGPGVDPHKVARLLDRLTLQEIEVRRSTEAVNLPARSFFALEGETGTRTFPAGTYFVDLAQPNARLARALLDPTVDFSNPQVELPYRRDMPYYDAPWQNLPFMFGVDAWALADAPPSGERVRATDVRAHPGQRARVPEGVAAGGAREAGMLGGREGRVEELDRNAPPYAWVWPAGREASYRLAIDLMREDFRVRVFTSPSRIEGEDFARGTFAALTIRNPDGLGDRIRALAANHGARAIAVAGPFTEAGVTFGDDSNLAALPPPRVAVLAADPVNHDHTYGGIRSVLEGDFGLAFSPVTLETLNGADLSGYTAVVLPHAGMDVRGGPNFSAGYRGRLDVVNLRRYVQGGGTLVAVQGAGAFLAEDEILGAGVSMDGWARRTEGTARGRWSVRPWPDDELVAWEPGLTGFGLPMLAAGQAGPKGLADGWMDGRDSSATGSPDAGAGAPSDVAFPASFPVLLSVAEEGATQVVARYADDPDRLLLDGFVPPEDAGEIAGRPFALVQPVGRGRVIYFAEDLTFRGAWYGMNTLFLNALLFGPVL